VATPAATSWHARLRRLSRSRADRSATGLFVIDGPLLVRDALEAGVELEGLWVETGLHDELAGAAEAAGVTVHVVPPDGVARYRLSDLVTPQGVVALARQPATTLADVIDRDLLLVLVGVGDPGNAGTLLRSAEATGVGAVLFCEGSVDPFSPKCVRASAGSIFHVPVVSAGGPTEVLERIGASGARRLATSAHRGDPYDEADLAGRIALVLGSEAHGLPADLERLLDSTVHVPMAGRTESLNVAVAGSVLLFEAARQRRRSVAPGAVR
jgi:TrmH family RNA methyltransferase